MKYSTGKLGRLFVVRFDHKEDLNSGINSIMKNEKIRFATIQLIGAIKSGSIVAGPKEDKIPPEPNKMSFSKSHEILGYGTIVNNGDSVLSHIHVSVGRGKEVLTGCLREFSEVFITVEAVITEINEIDAYRVLDPKIKQNVLKLK